MTKNNIYNLPYSVGSHITIAIVAVRGGGGGARCPRDVPPAAVPPPVQPRPRGAPPGPPPLQELLHRRPQAQGQEARRGPGDGQGQGVRVVRCAELWDAYLGKQFGVRVASVQ